MTTYEVYEQVQRQGGTNRYQTLREAGASSSNHRQVSFLPDFWVGIHFRMFCPKFLSNAKADTISKSNSPD